MTDIVDLLLNANSIYPIDLLRKEAAAEIERLREEKSQLLVKRNTEEMQRMIDYWGRRAEKAEDEVEQLQADKAAISDTASRYLHEIERLRLELANID